jgi:hypothetical protein
MGVIINKPTTIFSGSVVIGPNIVSDSLVLYLDASNAQSYSITSSIIISSASLAPFINPTGSFTVNGIELYIAGKLGGSLPSNTDTRIYIATGSRPSNTITNIISSFNFSSSIAPYSTSLQYITAQDSGSTGLIFTSISTGSWYITSGSTTTTEGNKWYDISGNNNTFVLTGNPSYNNTYFTFNSQKATCINNTFGNFGTGSFTLEYIIKVTGYSGGVSGGIYAGPIMKRYGVTNWNATSNRPGFGESTWSGAGYFGIQSTNNNFYLSVHSPPFNTLIHVTHTVDRTSNGAVNIISSYRNGSLIKVSPTTIFTGNTSIDNTYYTELMYINGENSYLLGNLYAVRAYNKALSATEVKQNFEAFKYKYNII